MTIIFQSRRSFIKASGAMVIAPALLGLSGTARAADTEVVGRWGGDYQRLLQQNIDPLLKPAGVTPIYDTGSALARQTKMRAEKKMQAAPSWMCRYCAITTCTRCILKKPQPLWRPS